jgi:F-type H+-transporting ATPase subunit b
MINKILLFCFVFFGTLLANDTVDISKTDIIPRTVNFIIFMLFLYYLLKDKIKNFLGDRTNSIIQQQERVQNILNESRKEKDLAKQKVEKAALLAKEMRLSINSEIILIKDKIMAEAKNEIENSLKQSDDKKALERSKVKKSVAKEVLGQIFEDKDIRLDDSQVANILVSKVA